MLTPSAIPNLFQGGFYFVFICGVDVIRVVYGPLPTPICKINYFLRNWFLMNISVFFCAQLIFQYLFICVWKRMRYMNTNLIVTIVVICTYGSTLWLAMAKMASPGRYHLLMVSNGKYMIKPQVGIGIGRGGCYFKCGHFQTSSESCPPPFLRIWPIP